MILTLIFSNVASAQVSDAVVLDGEGPWRDARWIYTAQQFQSMLEEAGYTVTIVSPADVLSISNPQDVLWAIPSLETLPIPAIQALAERGDMAKGGGSLLASGGEPFRNPLYLGPNGEWLDAESYEATTGMPPPAFRAPYFWLIAPSNRQYTASSGNRYPFVPDRGLYGAGISGTRFIGDLAAPAAVIRTYASPASTSPPLIIPANRSWIAWLPSAHLSGQDRALVVDALRAAIAGVHLQGAGPDYPVWLPGENITGTLRVVSMADQPADATFEWTITGGPEPMPQEPLTLHMPSSGNPVTSALNFPSLPSGDYTVQMRLMVGKQLVGSLDSPFRVLDPRVSRQPSQKIKAVDGAFYADGKRVFLHGVNFWPRYAEPLSSDWLSPTYYDPDRIEADLAQLESMNFNLVNIRYMGLYVFAGANGAITSHARSLIDFLERCRNHGIWARIELPATMGNNAFRGTVSPYISSFLEKAYLPGNDRVFAYELLWEPYIGKQSDGGYIGYIAGQPYPSLKGRSVLDPDWRAWVDEQYGSLDAAKQIWGIEPPVDDSGLLVNPTDEQMTTDGPWRIMVDAYRRFADDYLGRNLGEVVRAFRRTDPDALITYRNWSTMTSYGNENMGYDLGTGAAHLDFISPESYDHSTWPDLRKLGLITAYGRYRAGGKPIQWVEFGYDTQEVGGLAGRLAQANYCDNFMRLIEDDGSNADTVWWWPGGVSQLGGNDFGIVEADGTPRGCGKTLAEWGAKFRESPPQLGPNAVEFSIDRDADARGQYGLFLKWADQYAAAREAGQTVRLVDDGAGTDTSTMPVIQVGNVPYAGTGPLKYVNAEFGELHLVCPGVDAVVENDSQVQVPAGVSCQVTPTLVNTGEATWLPGSASNGGVILQTANQDVPLADALPALQKTELAPVNVRMDQDLVVLTGRMRVNGVGKFGEALHLTLAVNLAPATACSLSLSPAGPIHALSEGGSGTINVTAAEGCKWVPSSVDNWISFVPYAGKGSGSFTYTIRANSGPPRHVIVRIGDQFLTVMQDGTAAPSFGSVPSLSTQTLNFGSLTLGSASTPQTLTLTNAATSPLPMGPVTVGGANSADFTQSNNCGATVAPGANCSITVAFDPTATGSRNASLFVNASTGAGALVVSLSGTGVGTGPKPAVQAVADVWDYTQGIAPGLWVAIGGTNLSPYANIADLGAREQLPTNLDGVTVTFNGVPAALSYAGPGQINALVPASVEPGPVQIVADVSGVSSDPFPVTATATQPSIYALPNNDATNFSVTAALQGTADLIGNKAIDTRVERAANPGDILDLYMIGLGATNDPTSFVTDRQFAGAFPIAAPITAQIGGKSANVIFAGLTTPGLYLVRAQVPESLDAGNQPIEISLGTTPDQQKTSSLLSLTIGQPASDATPDRRTQSIRDTRTTYVNHSAPAAQPATSATDHASSDAPRTSTQTVTGSSTGSIPLGGVPLQAGQTYRLQFSAKADVAGAMAVNLTDPATGASIFNMTLPVTDTWQSYALDFPVTTTPTGDMNLSLVNPAGDLLLSDVSLEELPR